jgi:hypothetical protein
MWNVIFALTVRNGTRRDMRAFGGRYGSMVVLDGLLTIINHIERFPGREVAFPVNVILKQRRIIATVHLRVQDSVNVPRTFAILSKDRFSGFLALARQGVGSHMAQQGSVEDRMYFHRGW